MQKLAGIITEGEYKEKVKEITNGEDSQLDEAAAENLELKSLSKKIYLGLKKLGAQAKLHSDVMSPDPKKMIGKIDYSSPYGEIVVVDNLNVIQLSLLAPNKEEAYRVKNSLEKSFPNFEFKVNRENDGVDWDGKKTGYFMFIVIKAKSTGKKGGGIPAVTESKLRQSKMKKSELRQIIKEEIKRVLKENLDEAANTGLELKSFAKQLYTYAKQQGAQVSFQKTDTAKYDPKIGYTGIKKMGKDMKDIDRSKPMVSISIYDAGDTPYVSVGMTGDSEGLKALYNDIKSHFNKFEYLNYAENTIFPFEKDPSKKFPSISFQVKAKETGRKGGVAVTESKLRQLK